MFSHEKLSKKEIEDYQNLKDRTKENIFKQEMKRLGAKKDPKTGKQSLLITVDPKFDAEKQALYKKNIAERNMLDRSETPIQMKQMMAQGSARESMKAHNLESYDKELKYLDELLLNSYANHGVAILKQPGRRDEMISEEDIKRQISRLKKIKNQLKELPAIDAERKLSSFFGNDGNLPRERQTKPRRGTFYYGGRKTRRKRKSKYKVRMARRKTRRRVKRRKTRKRIKRRKKRKTRKAGNPPKQSEKAGTKGLTQREIDAREKLADARLKAKDYDAWKKKRLGKLKAFNKKLTRQNAFGSTRKNLDLDIHKASDEYNKTFGNLRVSPVTTGKNPGMDTIDDDYEELLKRMSRMSPVTFGQASQKTSFGGKKRKSRKKRKRKKKKTRKK